MKRLLGASLTTLMTGMALPAAAQESTIGTDPAAATVLENAGEDASWISQTFVATGSYLQSLSFWWVGGTNAETGDDFFNEFVVSEGVGFSNYYYSEALNQNYQGRYNITLDYLAMVTGSNYTFTLFGNICGGPCGTENPPGFGPPRTGTFRAPQAHVTTTDAYADGYYIERFDGPDFDRDIRFEATFVDRVPVPEPASGLLVLSGLFGLGWVGRRRRG